MDKEKLFVDRIGLEDYEVPGLGTIKLRALNRFQALLIAECKSTEQREIKMLKWGLVDPELTDAEIKRWYAASPAGEIENISKAIARLSGLMEGAAKEQFPTDGGELIG